MSDNVKFEEEEIMIDRASQVSRESAMTRFLMKLGVKSEAQANYVLIGILCVVLLATIYVVSRYLI